MNDYPNITELVDQDWTLMTSGYRYGGGTIVVLANYDAPTMAQALDTLSDGDDDALGMEFFLESISGWFPLARGRNFHEAMLKLEANLKRQTQTEEWFVAMSEVRAHLCWWEKIRYRSPCVRIGVGPASVDDEWEYCVGEKP